VASLRSCDGASLSCFPVNVILMEFSLRRRLSSGCGDGALRGSAMSSRYLATVRRVTSMPRPLNRSVI